MSGILSVMLCLATFATAGAARADLAEMLGEPANAARLDALTRVSETRNRATLLHLGLRSRPERLKLLAEARHSLFITVPYWFNDESGREFFAAVERKKLDQPDFDFRVLEDWTSPVSSGDPFGQLMFKWLGRLSGGNAVLWNPFWENREWSKDVIRNRIHDKFFVVDGSKLIMGGMNIADDYLQGGVTRKGWHDTDILFEGPVAQQAERDFLRPFLLQRYLDRASNPFPSHPHAALEDIFYFDPEENPDGTPVHIGLDRFLDDSRHFPPVQEPADGVPVRLIYDNPLVDHDPHDGEHYSKVIDTLEFLASKAQSSIRLFIAYPTTSARLNSILIGAARRGVRVELIANSHQSTDMGALDYLAGMVSVRKLVEAGVKVYEWQGHADLEAFEKAHGCQISSYWPGATLHTKVVTVDDSVAMIGSHNLNVRSEQMNSETMALIRDPGIAHQLDGIFDYDLDTGNDLALECGGRVYAGARPRRTLPVTLESMERRFRKEGLWLQFLNLLRPMM